MFNTEFPKSENTYLEAKDFQDQEKVLTFKGWKKKGNEDKKDKKGNITSWENRVQYMLKFSYPEMAFNPKTGQPILDKNGKPLRNRNYDPDFPHGYSIVYAFEEGTLECGSNPLWEKFCLVRPKVGDVISIKRVGSGMDTEWVIKKVGSEKTGFDGFPEVQVDTTPDPLDEISIDEPGS